MKFSVHSEGKMIWVALTLPGSKNARHPNSKIEEFSGSINDPEYVGY